MSQTPDSGNGPWREADQAWADMLTEALGDALELEPGQQVEHYIVAVQAGSGKPDGELRKVFVVACCRELGRPSHLMEHVIELLGGRN